MDGVYVAQETERETKQQPSMLPGPPVPGWCLVSFRFLCDIHSIHSVNFLCTSPIAMSTNGCPRPDVPPCIREGRESALIIVSIVRTSLTQIKQTEKCVAELFVVYTRLTRSTLLPGAWTNFCDTGEVCWLFDGVLPGVDAGCHTGNGLMGRTGQPKSNSISGATPVSPPGIFLPLYLRGLSSISSIIRYHP